MGIREKMQRLQAQRPKRKNHWAKFVIPSVVLYILSIFFFAWVLLR